MAKWFAPWSGGYAANCIHGKHRHGCEDSKKGSPGPPPKIPTTGGSGYGAGHAPNGLRPPPREITRTTITREGLLHLVVAREGLPMNTLGDQWAVAVSEILLDLLERGVELKTAADPDMPYQQYN